MKKDATHTKLTMLIPLLVLCVFAVCVLGVLLAGAQVYGRLTDRGQQTYNHRTAAQYIATRVRQADRAGSVAVEDFGGTQALVLREEAAGKTYLTRVYCHDGSLRELFTPESGAFSPDDGEVLLPVDALRLNLEDSILRAELIFTDGTKQTLTLYLRSDGEVLP